MSHISTVITAAPRLDEPTVQARCLTSILDAGFEHPTIFAEPETMLPSWVKEQYNLVNNRTRLGEWRNWMSAVYHAVSLRPKVDVIITMQDDIVFCKRAATQMLRCLWPGEHCGALHLYTSRAYRSYIPEATIGKIPAARMRSMAGACAIAFPRKAALDILEYGIANGWRGHTCKTIENPADKQGLDTFIGLALHNLGYDCYAHMPSLAETISVGSTLGHGGPHGNRRSAGFPGEKTDAITLFKPQRRYDNVSSKTSCSLQTT